MIKSGHSRSDQDGRSAVKAGIITAERELGLVDALVAARGRSSLTQQQIAERMKTSQAAVARLETGRGNPSLETLRRYAAATGSHLRITFEPKHDELDRLTRRSQASADQ